MSKAKLAALGFLIFVGVVFASVSVFTNAWIIDSDIDPWDPQSVVGLVPYPIYWPLWFQVVSVTMYISLGLGVLTILAFLFVVGRARHCCNHRDCLVVTAFAAPMSALEIFSFVMSILNVPVSMTNRGGFSPSVGYSGYLAMASGLTMYLTFLLSRNIARTECK